MISGNLLRLEVLVENLTWKDVVDGFVDNFTRHYIHCAALSHNQKV